MHSESSSIDTENKEQIFDKKLQILQELGFQVEDYILTSHISEGGHERLRTMIAFRILILITHYTNGFIALIKRRSIYSSEVILRSMIEGWINLHYIYASESYENLVRFLYDGDAAYINNARGAKKIFVDSQDEINDFTLLYDELMSERESAIDGWSKYGHALKRMPPIPERVRQIEVKFSSVDFSIYYYHEYSMLSTSVHVSKDKLLAMSYAKDYDGYFSGMDNTYIDAIRMLDTATDILCKSAKLVIRQTGKKPSREQAAAINRKVKWRVA